jgi:hypothetical protein
MVREGLGRARFWRDYKLLRILAGKTGFVPPLQGGGFELIHIPRVSPWAIFTTSLREEPQLLTGSRNE